MFFFKKYNLCLISFCVCFLGVSFSLHPPSPLFFTNNHTWYDVDFYEAFLKSDWDALSVEKKTSALENFINTELALLAAEESGLLLHPEIKEKIENQYLFSLINATYKNKIAGPLIDLDVVQKNKKHLQTEVETYHLLVGYKGSSQNTKSTLTKNQALLRADSLLFLINNNAVVSNNSLSLVDSFKAVAVDFSIDPSAKTNQGFLGWVPWGQTSMSFQEPLFNGDLNSLFGPVLTEWGYHLILKGGVRFSDFYYFSDQTYNDLAFVAAENTLSFDVLKSSAAEFDSLLIQTNNFKANPVAIELILSLISQGNKRGFGFSGFLEELNNLKPTPLVLFVVRGRGFGVGWLINKLNKIPSNRVPYIKNKEDFVGLLKTLVLQDIVFDLGNNENIASSSVFKRDFLKLKKNIVHNEYLNFLISKDSFVDSSLVVENYNKSVLSGMFIEPKRVVFSEIRVFDLGVAEKINNLVLSGVSFDSLLIEYGGSIKEPLSLGNNNPLTLGAFSLGVGEISSIIKNNQNSFSILRVEAFLEEVPFSLERVYSQIERDLLVKKQEAIKKNLFNFLIESFGVNVNFNVVGL